MARGRIEQGTVLQTALKHARWIALLTVAFLLTSVLDNIPDCPELNQKSGAISVHAGGHFSPEAVPLPTISIPRHIAPVQLSTASDLIADVLIPTPLARIVGSLCQAANTSPPLV
jgi:hypothetical protein